MIPNKKRNGRTLSKVHSSRYRRSAQRERILSLFRSTDTHPTAAWAYERLKAEFPRLSLGTVYRNIGILIDQGLIRRVEFAGTHERFDANMSKHYHFVCERCGLIVDLETPVDLDLNMRISVTSGLEVHAHQIQFYGLCGTCSGKKQQGRRSDVRT